MVHGAESSLPACHRVMRGADLLGFIAIDTSVAGRARGGLRLVTELAEDEVRDAAHAMTLKYGLLGLARAARRPVSSAIPTPIFRPGRHCCGSSRARQSRSCAIGAMCRMRIWARRRRTSAR